MNEEQKEKWYNSFTREQLIERCEYLQRSCERKENSIMELEMENADLEKGYCEIKEKCNRGECDCTNEEYNNMCEANIKLENEIERLNNDYLEMKDNFRTANDEIERLNTNWEVAKDDLTRIAQLLNLEEGCTIYDIEDEIERLHSIIKEVREYIETHLDNTFKTEFDYITTNPQELLEILDKVGRDKE